MLFNDGNPDMRERRLTGTDHTGGCGGFTVLEILFALIISVVVIAGVYASFLACSYLFYTGSRQMDIRFRAGYGIEYVASSICGAETATIQSNGDRIDLTVPTTNLSADVGAGDTTLPVVWTKLLPPSGIVQIEEEKIYYAEKNETTLLSCTRGYGGSSAASHSEGEIVYAEKIYYLSGTSIYLNLDGSPDPSGDQVVITNARKLPGIDLFQLIPQSDPYKLDRVKIAMVCFDDGDEDGLKDVGEPGVDLQLELLLRNNR